MKKYEEEKFGRVEGEGRFLWHDPCDLGRHSGVFDPPRNVLRSVHGLELVEPPLTRRHSQCCGGGGGLMAYDFGLAEKLAHSKVINDVEPLLVDGVVTGCLACIINLQSQLIDKKVLDISQLVYDCMF